MTQVECQQIADWWMMMIPIEFLLLYKMRKQKVREITPRVGDEGEQQHDTEARTTQSFIRHLDRKP
jgi:hypothetical protein